MNPLVFGPQNLAFGGVAAACCRTASFFFCLLLATRCALRRTEYVWQAALLGSLILNVFLLFRPPEHLLVFLGAANSSAYSPRSRKETPDVSHCICNTDEF